ncbi:p13 [Spodoptera frugiperda granulovirus]|uniref:p13 n=1 Tax=Spodoptera frugiperda granulovirus TaxID=307454 RepID=A0A0C5ASC1_9BBAC|nr:p13 [Spodoptera frugiperda granulovirus]AJK91697.1 p13 [Spodoptera frugiperda granulovirus]AXS01055.1 p13 [Spodoptera frugiperda granulovirus]
MFAYATLVMLGDKYVPGALALGQSLRDSGTPHRLLCMVTHDVSADAVQSLKQTYHTVVTVPYIEFKCGSMMTQRQKELYSDWIDYSFTKWRAFQLHMYDKIVYLDADQVVVKNIDHLFELQPPAMCFRSEFNKAYETYRHGDVITAHDLSYFFRNLTSLAATGTLLLTPDAKLFDTITKQLNPHNKYMKHNQFHNGFEEVVLIQALVELERDAIQLSQLYVWNAGCYKTIQKQEPYVINYYGDKKPWNTKTSQPRFMDEYIWRYFYVTCLRRLVKIAQKD